MKDCRNTNQLRHTKSSRTSVVAGGSSRLERMSSSSWTQVSAAMARCFGASSFGAQLRNLMLELRYLLLEHCFIASCMNQRTFFFFREARRNIIFAKILSATSQICSRPIFCRGIFSMPTDSVKLIEVLCFLPGASLCYPEPRVLKQPKSRSRIHPSM